MIGNDWMVIWYDDWAMGQTHVVRALALCRRRPQEDATRSFCEKRRLKQGGVSARLRLDLGPESAGQHALNGGPQSVLPVADLPSRLGARLLDLGRGARRALGGGGSGSDALLRDARQQILE